MDLLASFWAGPETGGERMQLVIGFIFALWAMKEKKEKK